VTWFRRLAPAIVVLAAAAALWWRHAPPVGAPVPLHTRHLNPDGSPTYTNRLARERSPYLQQHAHNPVDWYPWGDAAFEKARAEQKPVLLSIGYSTCHWCHVMEDESFEDDEIAAYLNAHYVAIKVDREERPDVDAVYMSAVESMGNGGGWPMTVWLTPDRRPFYGATYLPPHAGMRGVRVGFRELLERLADAYAKDPSEVTAAAADIAGRVEDAAASGAGAAPDAAALDRAYAELAPTFDAEHGGFGTRPKFPRPAELLLLLRRFHRTGDPAPLDMVVRTLAGMAAGGIHDQVGGGFHRYATDAAWRVPHFEKMLYDQALLTVAYLEAFQASGRADFADVARTTLAYLARDMQAPSGGFFAASDADSEGAEGKYFQWTAPQVTDVVGPEHAPLVVAYFDVGASPATLATSRPLDAVASDAGVPLDAARAAIDDARRRLLDARTRRVPPHVDRKVVTGWNGLAVSAFARASATLGDPALARVAARTADALLRARHGERLPRYLIDGEAQGDAVLDDYAFLTAGLLDLYEATFDPRWLREAVGLEAVLDARFADPQGGYFLTADDQEALLAREKPDYDGAEPAGNSVALSNLLRLHALTTDDRYRARAAALLASFGGLLARRPSALPYMLCGLDFSLARVKEIVLVTPDDGAGAKPFADRLASRFVPSHVLAVATRTVPAAALASLVPLVEEKTAIDGKPTAYVCEQRVCKLPTADVEEFTRQLGADAPPGGAHVSSGSSLARTSRTIASGARAMNRAPRACQSSERTWSARTTPVIGRPAGNATSNG
jgi:uncharacterized protein YyaL (SSP411 family)